MINSDRFDFKQRFMIGQGTGFVATMDTLDELISFHDGMDALDRHFCKVYDHDKHRMMDGYDFRWAQHEGNVEDSPRWRPW